MCLGVVLSSLRQWGGGLCSQGKGISKLGEGMRRSLFSAPARRMGARARLPPRDAEASRGGASAVTGGVTRRRRRPRPRLAPTGRPRRSAPPASARRTCRGGRRPPCGAGGRRGRRGRSGRRKLREGGGRARRVGPHSGRHLAVRPPRRNRTTPLPHSPRAGGDLGSTLDWACAACAGGGWGGAGAPREGACGTRWAAAPVWGAGRGTAGAMARAEGASGRRANGAGRARGAAGEGALGCAPGAGAARAAAAVCGALDVRVRAARSGAACCSLARPCPSVRAECAVWGAAPPQRLRMARCCRWGGRARVARATAAARSRGNLPSARAPKISPVQPAAAPRRARHARDTRGGGRRHRRAGGAE